MHLAEYKKQPEQLHYGKRLHTALYLYHEPGTTFGPTLDSLLTAIFDHYQIKFTPDFNVIKFRTDELKVSFLSMTTFKIHVTFSDAPTYYPDRGLVSLRRLRHKSELDYERPDKGTQQPKEQLTHLCQRHQPARAFGIITTAAALATTSSPTSGKLSANAAAYRKNRCSI